MKKINEEINCILAEWNPLNVDAYLVNEEYKAYVPQIIATINSVHSLKSCLEDILVNHLEIEYDSLNPIHVADLEKVISKISMITVSKDIGL